VPSVRAQAFDEAMRGGRKDCQHRAQQREVPWEPDPARDGAALLCRFRGNRPTFLGRLWLTRRGRLGMMFGNTEKASDGDG
jgi:hypothetical protein